MSDIKTLLGTSKPKRSQMLPFLKQKDQKTQAGVVVKTRTPDQPEEPDSSGIEACASALIDAVHAKDAKAAAEAIQDAFTILESLPHEETEDHIEPHSYQAQNQKAGI